MSDKNYIITTDSTTDFPLGYSEALGVKKMSLTYELDGEKHHDKSTSFEDSKAFYDKMRLGLMPTTSQINPEVSKEFFEESLKEGKDILHIAFSSGLSGTCQSAQVAAKELEEKYPDRKIYVIDSLMASMGEGLLVHYAVEKQKEGLDIDALRDLLEADKQKICAYFTVDDLNHLHRGGRVSKLTALFGTMLSIKPCLHIDVSGKLISIDKVRGRKKSLDWLVDKFGEKSTPDNDIVFLSHCDCTEDVEYVKSEIKRKYKVQNFEIGNVGPVIGSHSGPGTVALFFKAEERTEK